MTLVTIMGDLDFFLLKVQWHSDDLDLVCGTSLDDLIMTAEAECFDILSPFNRKFPYDLAIFDMISIWAVAHFAGNIFMDTSLMNRTDWTMTFKTRIVGLIPDGDIPLILNITPTVMTILTHCFREEYPPGKYPQTAGDNKYHRQSQHMCEVA